MSEFHLFVAETWVEEDTAPLLAWLLRHRAGCAAKHSHCWLACVDDFFLVDDFSDHMHTLEQSLGLPALSPHCQQQRLYVRVCVCSAHHVWRQLPALAEENNVTSQPGGHS